MKTHDVDDNDVAYDTRRVIQNTFETMLSGLLDVYGTIPPSVVSRPIVGVSTAEATCMQAAEPTEATPLMPGNDPRSQQEKENAAHNMATAFPVPPVRDEIFTRLVAASDKHKDPKFRRAFKRMMAKLENEVNSPYGNGIAPEGVKVVPPKTIRKIRKIQKDKKVSNGRTKRR